MVKLPLVLPTKTSICEDYASCAVETAFACNAPPPLVLLLCACVSVLRLLARLPVVLLFLLCICVNSLGKSEHRDKIPTDCPTSVGYRRDPTDFSPRYRRLYGEGVKRCWTGGVGLTAVSAPSTQFEKFNKTYILTDETLPAAVKAQWRLLQIGV